MFASLLPDRFFFQPFHLTSFEAESATNEDILILPQAITRPAILLEALMANAIALGQGAGNILLDNDAYQMLLHRAIEKFGPKSTSLPLQDCEGIGQVGKSCLILFCSFSHRPSSTTIPEKNAYQERESQ